jgi:hypothetical protein
MAINMTKQNAFDGEERIQLTKTEPAKAMINLVCTFSVILTIDFGML